MSTVVHLTTEEYDRMVLAGAFDGLEKRIELIHGVIREMNPAGPLHDDLIMFLTQWSIEHAASGEIRVTVRTGLNLAEFNSRPEPDLMWVMAKRYRDSHPRAGDVILLIEIADSSLPTDTGEKEKLYAAAGIGEYWVVNAFGRVVQVYRRPSADGYLSLSTFGCGETVTPADRPDARLDVAKLFAED